MHSMHPTLSQPLLLLLPPPPLPLLPLCSSCSSPRAMSTMRSSSRARLARQDAPYPPREVRPAGERAAPGNNGAF